jgi:PmbA protein
MSTQSKKTPDDMLEVARRAVELARKAGAKEVAATASRARQVDVNWRDGKLDRVTEATTRQLSMALYVDGRYSAASTSDLRPAALEKFVAEGVALARTLAVDEHRHLPDPELYAGRSTAELELDDGSQASLTPQDRQARARAAEEAARGADPEGRILSVTTAFGDTAGEMHRVTSNGFEGSQRSSTYYVSAEVSVKDPDGRRPEEYDYGVTRWLTDLADAAAVGRSAAERTLGRIGSVKAKSAVTTMIVENRAAGRLTGMLLGPLMGANVQQKRSFLEGKLGEQVGSKLLHFTDDPFIKRGHGSRHWDGEGITARRMPIFEDGKVKGYYIDSYYGRKLGEKPTTGGMSNLDWRLGGKDLAALIAGVKDGFLVTSFLGGNSNGATGDFSLGVQGNRIVKGKIAEPIGEMNISANQLDFWKRLVAVGNDPFLGGSSRTPSLVFDKVQFAGV